MINSILRYITLALMASSICSQAIAKCNSTITNLTSTHQIRVKEGFLYRTNKILFPNEKIRLTPLIAPMNFSVEYYDEYSQQFVEIPNCERHFTDYGFKLTVRAEGNIPTCRITAHCKIT